MRPEDQSQWRSSVESVIEQFEDAWIAGERPRIEDFLLTQEGDSVRLLLELVHTDLEYRLKRGESARVEEYLERFPALQAETHSVIELILAEYHFRRSREHDLSSDEYFRRFSQYGPQLAGSPLVQAEETDITPTDGVAQTTTLPDHVGRYRIGWQIGRGGMGTVLRVFDVDFERPLAMKILREDLLGDAHLESRFLEEAQISGGLQHPGIAPLHELGKLPDQRPFFTMKLIEGQTLAELLRKRESPSEELPRFLGIFEQICQAIGYAHSQRILHRDLKPANIMVGAFGEVQVMDWGLAKRLVDRPVEGAPKQTNGIAFTETSRHPREQDLQESHTPRPGMTPHDYRTRAGEIIGTPAFLSPEQARGDVDQIDPRSDVFGLGAILCMILTGKPPYQTLSVAEMIARVIDGDLTEAHQRLDQSGVDQELIQLAKQCLAADKWDRPKDGSAVARAIADYQSKLQERLRQTELARAQTEVKVAEERKRRHVTVGFFVTMFLLLLGATGGGFAYQHLRHQRALEAQTQQQQDDRDFSNVVAELRNTRIRAENLLHYLSAQEPVINQARDIRKRLQDLLVREERPVSARLQEQAREEIERLAALEKDRTLFLGVERFNERAANVADLLSEEEYAKLMADLREDLSDYGFFKLSEPIDRVVSQIRSRPKIIQQQLTLLLDSRLAHRDSKPQEVRWCAKVLAEVDPDPFRDKVRKCIANQDRLAFSKLAHKLSLVRETPTFLESVMRWYQPKDKTRQLNFLRSAREHYPNDFWLNMRLGITLIGAFPTHFDRPLSQSRRAELQEASTYLTAATAIRPKNYLAHTTRGAVFHRLGQYSYAEAAYVKASGCQVEPNIAPTMLSQLYCDQHRWDDAIQLIHKAIQAKLQSPELYYNLGVAWAGKKEWDKAIDAYRKALDFERKFPPAYANLGASLAQKGQYEEAEKWLNKAVEMDDNLPEAHATLCGIYLTRKDFREAEKHGQKAVKLNPDHPGFRYNLGQALVHQRFKAKQAVAEFQKCVQLEPNNSKAHTLLGSALVVQQDFAGAAKAYSNAIQADPKNLQAYYGLSGALGNQKKYKETFAVCREALKIDSNYAEIHFQLGNVWHALRDFPKAEKAFEKAIACKANYGDAHARLVLVYRDQGQFQKALTLLQKMSKMDFGVAGSQKTISGWIRECQEFVRLDEKLSKILEGKVEATKTEAVQLAAMCQLYKSMPRAAVRFYEQAFREQPQLLKSFPLPHRYNAACAAVQATEGKGKDTASISGKEKSQLRKKALKWLQAELQLLQTQKSNWLARTTITQKLQHMKQDPDLKTVRGAEAIKQLPSDERQEWERFWSDSERLLRSLSDGHSHQPETGARDKERERESML